MDVTAAFAVAPTRNVQRAGDDPGAGVPGPPDCVEERFRAVRLPVGEQQFRVGGDRVEYLAAENAMLAVTRFQDVIFAERSRLDLRRQGLAQKLAVVAKAGIKDGDLRTLAALAFPLSTRHTRTTHRI